MRRPHILRPDQIGVCSVPFLLVLLLLANGPPRLDAWSPPAVTTRASHPSPSSRRRSPSTTAARRRSPAPTYPGRRCDVVGGGRPLRLSSRGDGDGDGDGNGDGDGDGDDAASRAERLRILAARARLEAERLESKFALEQIAKLEDGLEARRVEGEGEGGEEVVKEVRDRIGSLRRRLEPKGGIQPLLPTPVVPPLPSTSSTSSPSPDVVEGGGEEVDEELQEMIDDFSQALRDFEEYRANLTMVKELGEEDREALAEIKEVTGAFGAMFDDDEKEMLGEFAEEMFTVVTANAAANATNATVETGADVFADFDGLLSGNVTADELEIVRAVGGFFRSLKQFANISVADEIRSVESEMKRMEELSKDDPNIEQKVALLRGRLPSAMLDAANVPDRRDVERFVEEVLLQNPTSFRLSSKEPRDVFCAYIVEGTNQLADGNELVARLEGSLERSSSPDLAGRLRFFWTRDPTSSGFEDTTEVQLADVLSETDGDVWDVVNTYDAALNPPVLLITGPNVVAPETRASDGIADNLLGIASVAFFSGSCLLPVAADASVLEKMGAGLASPALLVAVLATQLIHELAHYIAALGVKMKLALPTIVPWPGTGLLGGVTAYTSPPRNANALFDFSAAGPAIGMLASIASLLAGLKLTLAMDQALLLDLPRLPIETLKLSSLACAIVESVMSFDVLSSLDPTSSDVPCHPLTIAGYVGIIANGLSLLPLHESTDGFRMSLALFGRSSFTQGIPVVFATLFLLVQGVREWDVSKVLLLYLFLYSVFFEEEDIPCVNAVDKADGPRLAIFLATSILAFVALSPVL